MPRRSIQFIQGEYYHIYNRGCNREDIFRSEENYLYLLRLLRTSIEEHKVRIIAYCLMPNHYHLLFRQDSEIPVSELIQDVFNRYSKAFNNRFQRTGTLFEGPFKAVRIDKEGYLVHLCRYIHRNPMGAGLVKLPEHWRFSNYLEWIGKRKGRLVDVEFVKSRFESPQEYIEFAMKYEPPEKLNKGLSKYTFD